MFEMWERLSLRTRLLLPLGLMFVAALLAGAVSLQIFATAQLMEESEPAAPLQFAYRPGNGMTKANSAKAYR